MLSPALRAFLVSGPHPKKKKAKALLDLGGSAHVRVEWRRHRQELLDACPMGKRPWAFWMIEQGLSHHPSGERGELRAIRTLGCYRDDVEKEFVRKRLAVITAELRSHFHRRVA
jgi:hypothetical protein